jgi:hypothetical protein
MNFRPALGRPQKPKLIARKPSRKTLVEVLPSPVAPDESPIEFSQVSLARLPAAYRAAFLEA